MHLPWWPVAAAAAEPADDEGRIRTLLEQYRQAMQSGRLEDLAPVYTELSPDQRDAQERYFASVRDLEVNIGEIDVAIVGDEAVVSYTRTDHFVDRRTGRPMEIAVRLTKMLLRRDGEWKLKAGE
jgi:ketosteroid isomerase-like protein